MAPLLMLVGCGSSTKGLSRDTKAILRGATKVEVFRIDADDGREVHPTRKASGKGNVGRYSIVAQGDDQGPEFAAKLAGVLLDESGYSNMWARCFWPGVAFRVWKGKQSIDVLVCFTCDNLYCGPASERAGENISFAGSSMRRQLVELAKEAFPDDTEVQALEP
jgi:hypothetical protein